MTPFVFPAKELPAIAWKRIVREVRSRTAPQKPKAIKVGSSLKLIAAEIRERQEPRFFGIIPEQAALIPQFFPEVYYSTLNQADQIRAHKFDLLGSGEVDLGWPINWQHDFKHDYTWPQVHHSRLTLVRAAGGIDVKVPWELNRFHHTLRLGQAFLYTWDEAYAREAVNQITHWIKTNPYGFGVNWAGPMDIAIRAVNWIWTYYMLIESEAVTESFLALWLASFQEHGEFLSKHLEDGWPRTNHLIANLAGLAYLGIVFPEFEAAQEWRETGLNRLWEELERQINPDGMDYEASISYHRLVTEMVLSVAALCVINEIKIPEVTRARMRAMLDVIMAYTPPHGLAPIIGDADDGHFLPLSVYDDPVRRANDHRHLLALGSLVLERESVEWAGYVEPNNRGWALAAGSEWQDAFWYFATDASARLTETLTSKVQRPVGIDPDQWIDVGHGIRVRAYALSEREPNQGAASHSRGFEASGLYVMCSKDVHLVIDAGEIGQNGNGGHAHNDTLSFTMDAYGEQFLIDPGSYLYTSEPAERNIFRSTAYHNTLQIGSEEINRIPQELFRLEDDARVVIHRWVSNESFDLLDASHSGYTRLATPLVHRRRWWFEKRTGMVLVNDLVYVEPSYTNGNGSNGHQKVHTTHLTSRYHFSPARLDIVKAHKALRFRHSDKQVGLIIMSLGDFGLKTAIKKGWHAPTYGVKVANPVMEIGGEVSLPIDIVLMFYPYQRDTDYNVVRAAGFNALKAMREALVPGSNVSRSINRYQVLQP